MLYCYYYLRDSISRLEYLEKVFKKQIENPKKDFKFTLHTANIKETYCDICYALQEYCVMDSYYYNKAIPFLSLLEIVKKELLNAKDVKEFYNVVQTCNQITKNIILKDFEDAYEGDYSENYAESRTKEYDCFKKEIFESIRNGMSSQNRSIKVLHLNAKIGLSSDNFKQCFFEDCYELYGVDIKESIDTIYKYNYKRIIYGPLTGSIISNGTFDFVVYSTNFSKEKKDYYNFNAKREEKEYLTRAIQYLRKDGYLLLNIPKFKLYKDLCLLLVKNFYDIKVINPNNTNRLYDVYILAKKRANKEEEIDQQLYNNLRYNIDSITVNLSSTMDLSIVLPRNEIDLKQFRGSIIGKSELMSLYKKSTATKMFWEQQNENMSNNNNKIPLLPFNAGQLGLVLTSGFLDGVIVEDNEHCHVVKGRTVKRTENNDNIEAINETIEVTEITSNRVEINAFLPDGTFKKLA